MSYWADGGKSSHIHPQAQREWLDLLEAPIEGIIRKANRQIRSTKIRERLTHAKGLLLIVNDGNFLVTVPEEFMTLVAGVLQKQTEGGGRKFPISGALCIFLIGSLRQGSKTSFGFQVQLNPSPIPLCGFFKASLRTEWSAYFSRITRRAIAEDVREVPPAD